MLNATRCRSNLHDLIDFDFGEARLKELSEECNFPWVLSNAYSSSGGLLASAKKYLVREHKGLRIGFFGLAGRFDSLLSYFEPEIFLCITDCD